METRTRWIIGVSLAGLILFGPDLYQVIRLSFIQHRLDQQLLGLAKEQERLEQERERLESDPVYVESLIRSTFKVAKPGEYVIPLDAAATPRPIKASIKH